AIALALRARLRRFSVASQLLVDAAATPPLRGGEYSTFNISSIHSHLHRPPLQCIRRLKNFREIIRQYLVEAHVGDDELLVLGVQSDTPRFFDLALRSADEPAWWSVTAIIDTPDTDEDTFRFLFLVFSRLRGNNPTLGRLHLNL